MPRILPLALLGLTTLLSGCAPPESAPPNETEAARPASAPDYEVWVVDQSDSPGSDFGGTLYIFRGGDFGGVPNGLPEPAEVIDLAGAASELCRERTGVDPVRPHMLLFNDAFTHASLAFVASGHVLVMDTASREPLECIQATRSPTGQQAHAAFPSSDGSYILVANQNGKRLERIDTDYTNNTFTHNLDATLDLATCTTPSGAACEAAGIRPDNAPICPVLTDDSDLAFVTLRGGGLLVVDPRATPMRIVAEYDMETVRGNGCGGEQVNGSIYVNSGGRPGHMEHLHLYGFDVYRFEREDFGRADAAFPPNRPEPVLVLTRDGENDSHGVVATGEGRYLWVLDRHADVAEVIEVATDAHVRTIELRGEHTDNAAPDLVDRSPDGRLVFIAFRGPTPLSGDPHIATGATPGMAVMEVIEEGSDGRLLGIIRFSNVGEDGVERADPHALRVRWLEE